MLLGLPLLAMALAQANSFDVRSCGAKGDGSSIDTAAIQTAVDRAEAAGGGEVVFSAGRYLSGTIRLKSNVTIHLLDGAVLAESPSLKDFDRYEPLTYNPQSDRETSDFAVALLAGRDIHDVRIVGPGVLDGNRTERGNRAGPKPIAFKRCHDIQIRDVTVRNAPNYAVSLLGCERVLVDGVRVVNGYSDGIDPDCCRSVTISNCYVECYDDGICLKSSFALGRKVITEDVAVTNCVFHSASNQFKLGTESNGGFRNITLSNCTMSPRGQGKVALRDRGGITLIEVNGGSLEGVTISNIVIRDLFHPVFVYLGKDKGAGPGSLRHVTISNVIATGATAPCIVSGLADSAIEDVVLENIETTALPVSIPVTRTPPDKAGGYAESNMFGDLPAYGIYARHVHGLRLRGLSLGSGRAEVRPSVFADDVQRLELSDVAELGPTHNGSFCALRDVRDAFIHGCRPWSRETTPVSMSGKCRGVRLVAN